ncbi:unnamed protein product [Schistocephalus solidus]|uniref:Uncharacterized protein n=1 Tax=Schistocephalus solidus TaxID=70667 RepID=A0A183SVB6_SCHSO|nr:unnamed protein product [Schistocephalus solidus]
MTEQAQVASKCVGAVRALEATVFAVCWCSVDKFTSLCAMDSHPSLGLKLEPHLGDDEAVIHPTIGITDHLRYQHVLSISPPDENIVQQLPAPRPRVHQRGLLPRWRVEEGVGQQETVFRTRSQKKEAVIVYVGSPEQSGEGSSTTLQGHSEDFAEATADQPGDLERSRPEQTCLEKDSEDRSSNLRSQQDRRHHDQKSGTKVTNAPDQHRQSPRPANMPTLSTHLPHANRPGRTSSDAMHQQSDNANFYVKFCQNSFGLPPPSPMASIPLLPPS